MKFRFSLAAAVAAVLFTTASYSKAIEEKIRIADEPLNHDSEIVPGPTSSMLKLFLSAYAQEANEIKTRAVAQPGDAERLKSIENHVRLLLAMYDYAAEVSSVALTLSFQVGAELPLNLIEKLPGFNRLPLKWGAQGSFGVTVGMTRSELTNNVLWRDFSIGASAIVGGNTIFGKRVASAARPGMTGINWMFPAIAVVLPMNEELTTVRMGDLQGWYLGGAGEISTDTGEANRKAKTIQGGFYAKLNGLSAPDAGMFFGFHGIGGQDRPISGQAEALDFQLLVGSDDSSIRSPIPYVGNFFNSRHSDENRAKDLAMKLKASQEAAAKLTPEQIYRRMQEVQGAYVAAEEKK